MGGCDGGGGVGGALGGLGGYWGEGGGDGGGGGLGGGFCGVGGALGGSGGGSGGKGDCGGGGGEGGSYGVTSGRRPLHTSHRSLRLQSGIDELAALAAFSHVMQRLANLYTGSFGGGLQSSPHVGPSKARAESRRKHVE